MNHSHESVKNWNYMSLEHNPQETISGIEIASIRQALSDCFKFPGSSLTRFWIRKAEPEQTSNQPTLVSKNIFKDFDTTLPPSYLCVIFNPDLNIAKVFFDLVNQTIQQKIAEGFPLDRKNIALLFDKNILARHETEHLDTFIRLGGQIAECILAFYVAESSVEPGKYIIALAVYPPKNVDPVLWDMTALAPKEVSAADVLVAHNYFRKHYPAFLRRPSMLLQFLMQFQKRTGKSFIHLLRDKPIDHTLV